MSQNRRKQRRRAYNRCGAYGLRRQVPGLLDRARDPSIPASELGPVEVYARELRTGLLADLGGPEHVSTARALLVDAAVGSALVLSAVDVYIVEVAGGSGVVDRRGRKLRRVAIDRERIASGLTRTLLALGLDRRRPPPESLAAYLERRTAETSQPPAAAGPPSPIDRPDDAEDLPEVERAPAPPGAPPGRPSAEADPEAAGGSPAGGGS